MAKYNIKPIIKSAKIAIRDSVKIRNSLKKIDLKKAEDQLKTLYEIKQLLKAKWDEPTYDSSVQQDKKWKIKQEEILKMRNSVDEEVKNMEVFLNKEM